MTTDDPRPEAFGSLFVLAQHLTNRLDAALAPLGLTSRQWLLLAVLDRGFADEAPSLSRAARQFGTSRQNVKAIAEGLARRGWVTLQPDPRDRRTTLIHLTDKIGRFHEPDTEAQGEALLATTFAGLDPNDVSALRTLLVRMVAGLQHTAED
jgi:DNA-binding MarR family transcriptional regulator